METFKKLYRSPDKLIWQGRFDGNERDSSRWHQLIECVDLNYVDNLENSVVILGFCSDEGVRRNLGRQGAKDAPDYLRKVLANLPVHFNEAVKLLDAGNIVVNDNDLESAQEALQFAVSEIREKNGYPLLIGGGHEITYGHFKGLQKNDRNISIINIDTHLDIRPLVDGKGNSGTGFYQINEDLKNSGQQFHYLAIGIQEIANTKSLIQYADSQNVQIIYGNALFESNLENIINRIDVFASQVDDLYLTIDMDAFAAPYASGVSALAFDGIIPNHTFYTLLNHIFTHPKLISLDIAELNSVYDLDGRTAKLAANFIFKYLQKF